MSVANLLAQKQNTLVELFKRNRFEGHCTREGKFNQKQFEALQILTDKTTTYFAFGGAAGGSKSWTGCTWLVFMCLLYPETTWFIGREELKNLRKTTLRTLYKVLKHYGVTGWKYNGQDQYIQFTNGSRIDLLDLKYLPSDELYERFGSLEYTGGWIEEAGEINFGAYDTLKTRIGRQKNEDYGLLPKLFVTLNPKKNWVYHTFWKPFKTKTLPDNTRFLQSFATDNPFNAASYINQLNSITDKVKRARLRDGDFEYADDETALIIYDKMLDCFSNTHVPEGRKCITTDLARMGGDKIVMITWSGFRGHIQWWDKTLLDATAKKIENARFKLQCGLSDVLVDQDGLGGGIVDYEKYRGFVNNAAAVNSPDQTRDIQNNTFKENYRSKKAQCSYRMANRINNNGLYLTYETEDVKQAVIDEMEQVKKKEVDTDKKLDVLSKQEVKHFLGRSTDFWDAIMMREDFELVPQFHFKPREEW